METQKIPKDTFQEEVERTRKILADPEKTLPALIFSTTGHIVCKITRRKEPLPWYFNFIVLTLVIQLPTLIISNLLNETKQWTVLLDETKWWTFTGLIWMGYIELGLFATAIARYGVFYLYRNVNKYVLGNIQVKKDLKDLQRVLARARSFKGAVFSTLVFTLFWCISFSLVSSLHIKQPIVFEYISFESIGFEFIGFGLFIGTIVFGLLTGPALYMEGWFFFFIIHVGSYSYNLNETSPAHSEVIAQLSRIITTLLYSFAVFIALATLAVVFNIGAILLVTLIGWIPTIIYFWGGQRSLSKIITSAKWKTLNRIQEKIKALNKSDIGNKDNIESINRLMDYYERIRITPNSTFNVGIGFSLFNQLALPLTGLLVANIEKIHNLFPSP